MNEQDFEQWGVEGKQTGIIWGPFPTEDAAWEWVELRSSKDYLFVKELHKP